MSNRDVALEYLRRFCAGDVDGLEPLLSTDVSFAGTLHAYDSASEYLDALRRDPPEACGYKVLSITEGENAVAVFYEYQKRGRVLTVAQLFRITEHQIDDVLLVFDGRGVN